MPVIVTKEEIKEHIILLLRGQTVKTATDILLELVSVVRVRSIVCPEETKK